MGANIFSRPSPLVPSGWSNFKLGMNAVLRLRSTLVRLWVERSRNPQSQC
jgi:hypothetical protein